jgi:hypothetical protein
MTVPRIRIRPTPANDLYMLLCRLAPSGEIAQLIQNPARAIRDRRAEFRFLWQLVESRGLFGRTGRTMADPRPAAPTPAAPIRTRESILR